jgi:hypothetical protein
MAALPKEGDDFAHFVDPPGNFRITNSQSHCLWQWNNKRFYRCSEYDEYYVSTQKMRNRLGKP